MKSRPHPRHPSRLRPAHAQRGVALYIALIMLILLAMIGIVGMQVAGMQERMASSYRAVNRAFQAAEGVVRQAECAIEAIANRTAPGACTNVTAGDIDHVCDAGFDPAAWGEAQSLAAVPVVNVRQIDTCVQGEGTLDMGGPQSENAFPIYQITSYAADDDVNPSSSSVIDTIFKL
ncbi:MAG: pilus assembly protein [Proteobacteria bacterium]|nr:pilus assembly protein [Pseudomonadota bacterium]